LSPWQTGMNSSTVDDGVVGWGPIPCRDRRANVA
jgi:hypothetical protein